MKANQIYVGFSQIMDLVGDRILRGEYPPEERIPSVREMAIDLEVSPQTVVRAYERLTRLGIIYTQRGLGFFVSQEAISLLKKERTERLHSELLPSLGKELELLGLGPEVLVEFFSKEKNKQTNV